MAHAVLACSALNSCASNSHSCMSDSNEYIFYTHNTNLSLFPIIFAAPKQLHNRDGELLGSVYSVEFRRAPFLCSQKPKLFVNSIDLNAFSCGPVQVFYIFALHMIKMFSFLWVSSPSRMVLDSHRSIPNTLTNYETQVSISYIDVCNLYEFCYWIAYWIVDRTAYWTAYWQNKVPSLTT